MDNRVAIIGAGMGGLGAAHTLKKKGVPAVAFEMGHKAGGRMTTEKIGDFHVDVGASYIFSYFERIRVLTHELSMQDQLTVIPKNKASLYRDGKFHTLTLNNPATLLSFTGLSPRAKLAALGILPHLFANFLKANDYLNPYKALEIDDNEPAYDFLLRTTSQEFTDCFADAIIRALCMYSIKDLSKLNLFTYFYMLVAKIMRLQTLRDGIGSVPQRLARDLDVRYQTKVLSVRQKHDRVEVAWETDGKQEAGDFCAAVVAVWGDTVPEIVKDLSPVSRSVLSDTRYSTTTPVVLTLDQPVGVPFQCTYIGPGESDILASFAIEEVKGNLGVPPGKGCLLCLTREEFAAASRGQSKEETGEIVAKEAQRFFPSIAGHITGIHAFRWDRAVEKYPPGRMPLLHGMRGQMPTDGRIFLAGSYLIAPTTEAAFTTGVQAAEQVLKLLA